jgi:uncharacterized protein (TIGR02145 family)
MKKRFLIYRVVIPVVILFLTTDCKKDEPAKDESAKLAVLSTVSTTQVTNFTTITAASGGEITSAGGGEILTNGVCWSTTANPVITDSKTVDAIGTPQFVSSLSGLTAGTSYHVRAYATNSAGTAYGEDVTFTTLSSTTVSDVEDNIYNIITIGVQVWMVENLKTTKFNDGTEIPNITGNAVWPTDPASDAYCWYNNDVANKTPYGALYNVVAVNNDKLCPVGWHVATNDDWYKLILFLDPNATQGIVESQIAGGMMKESGIIHWDASNEANGTNESGFTALPGGIRYPDAFGSFAQLGYNANYWSAGSGYEVRLLVSGNQEILNKPDPSLNKGNGNSVRCIKN